VEILVGEFAILKPVIARPEGTKQAFMLREGYSPPRSDLLDFHDLDFFFLAVFADLFHVAVGELLQIRFTARQIIF